MFDIIISNGRVFDGKNFHDGQFDLGIRDGKITAVGNLSGAKAGEYIDASGLIVSPGFIDIHSHNDMSMKRDPMAESYIRQGITTAVGGNCGGAPHPMAEHFKKVEALEHRINYACLAGGNQIRQIISKESTPLSADQIRQMKKLLKDDFESGALGLSSGVRYMPFFTTRELIELAGVAAQYETFYASHIRNESEDLVDSIEEFIEICRESGASGQISHLKCLGKAAAGKSDRVIEMVEEARKNGLDITADLYPYDASSNSLLGAMVGHDNLLLAELEGSQEALLYNEKIRKPAEACFQERYRHFDDGVSVLLGPVERKTEWCGKSLAEYLDKHPGNPYEETVKLCLDQDVKGIYRIIPGKDIENFLKRDWVMACTDGWMENEPGDYMHPRSFGSFPRFIANYVRDKQTLTMAEALKKMTSMPAQRLGFKRRGSIAENMIADIVIFDPLTIKDRADYRTCRRYPEGFKWIIIGGNIALKDDIPVNKGFGKLIRRNES